MTSAQLLSLAERRFLVDGVAHDVRSDGRLSGTFRPVRLETGVWESCAGSARVRVGAADVAAGVKFRVVSSIADVGLVEFGVEFAAGVSAAGVDAADLTLALRRTWAEVRRKKKKNSKISNRIQIEFKSISQGRCLNLHSLCIAPHRLAWCVNIDAIIHSTDGNLLDVLAIAARAALQSARLPAVKAIFSDRDAVELDVDPDVAAGSLLDVSRVPLSVTLTRVGAQQHFVVDATREELACSSGSLAVAVNPLGRTCALEKRGHSSLDPATLFTMLHTARSVGAQLIASLDRALADGTQMRPDTRGFMN